MAISFDQREAFRMLAGSPNGRTDPAWGGLGARQYSRSTVGWEDRYA
jgi:hypothetical protein